MGESALSSTFHDHFSRVSGDYARSRPTYPDALFARLAALAPAREAAWDCATGNGQAALGLARHFARVEATDASEQQVAAAIAAPNIAYSVQPAERTRFADASFDAVCVAQALHWFDVERFYAEVKRVLRPQGVILVTGYGWSSVSRDFDRALRRVVIEEVKSLWPPQNALLVNGYRDLPFPFEPVEFPKAAIEVEWTFDQTIDYVGTWSATRRKLEADPGFLDRARGALREAWGSEATRTVSMPLVVLCGRHA